MALSAALMKNAMLLCNNSVAFIKDVDGIKGSEQSVCGAVKQRTPETGMNR